MNQFDNYTQSEYTSNKSQIPTPFVAVVRTVDSLNGVAFNDGTKNTNYDLDGNPISL